MTKTETAPGPYDAILDLIMRLNQRKAELQGILATAEADEHEARRQALEADPSKRSDSSGGRGDVGKVLRRTADAEKALPAVEAELRAAGEVFAGLKAEQNDKQIGLIEEEVAELNDQEAEHVARLVDSLEVFMQEWGSIAAFWAKRAQKVFLDGDHISENDVEAKTVEGRRPFLSPQPMDVLGMFECLYEVCADPRNIGVRDGHPTSVRSSAVFNKAWLNLTRDLRHLDTYAALPPSSHARYGANIAAQKGEDRAVFPQFRDKVTGQLPPQPVRLITQQPTGGNSLDRGGEWR